MVLSFIDSRPGTDVGVRGRGFDGFGGRARTVEPGLEDGAHGGVADRVDGERPLAGCFQPTALVASRQSDDAHGGTITLFGCGRSRINRSTSVATQMRIRAAILIKAAGVI